MPVGPTNLLQERKYVPELSLANFSSKNLKVHVHYTETSVAAPALARWLTIDNTGETTTAGFIKLETNPAGKALAEIGDPAIPALVGVLDHGTLRERRYAIYALDLISSPLAKKTLHEQLKRESDPALREFMEKTLGS